MIRLSAFFHPVMCLRFSAGNSPFYWSCYIAAAYSASDEYLQFYLIYDSGWRQLGVGGGAVQAASIVMTSTTTCALNRAFYLAQQCRGAGRSLPPAAALGLWSLTVPLISGPWCPGISCTPLLPLWR